MLFKLSIPPPMPAISIVEVQSHLCFAYINHLKHVFACGLVTVPQIHTAASDCLGWGGVGWGGMITSLALPHDLDATLYDLHWQFHIIWMVLKEAIPGSLPSKKGQARNPQIWKCMRSFQWRWECAGKNLMETTADTLKKN